MSEHKAQLNWKRKTESFDYEKYNRDHSIAFNAKTVIKASAAGELKGDPDNVDPEQGLTAALSSCHMLTFLAIASRKRYIIDSYEDEAVGFLEKNEAGVLCVARVILQPKTKFSGDKIPSEEELHALHESAHKYCIIANSVSSKIEIKLTG
jgi:organic hydroperoxide reductase OsmC/OhrA